MIFSILHRQKGVGISPFRSPTESEEVFTFYLFSSSVLAYQLCGPNFNMLDLSQHRFPMKFKDNLMWAWRRQVSKMNNYVDTGFTICQTTHNGGVNFAFQNFCPLLGAQVTSFKCFSSMKSSIDLSGLLAEIAISSREGLGAISWNRSGRVRYRISKYLGG